MAGESDGSQAVLVSHQHTRAQTSSLLGTDGLRPSISFSTNYPEPPKKENGKWTPRRTTRESRSLANISVWPIKAVERFSSCSTTRQRSIFRNSGLALVVSHS